MVKLKMMMVMVMVMVMTTQPAVHFQRVPTHLVDRTRPLINILTGGYSPLPALGPGRPDRCFCHYEPGNSDNHSVLTTVERNRGISSS